jgi:hypothetical protein
MRRHLALSVSLSVFAALLGVSAAKAAARPKCQGRRATVVGTKANDRIRGTRRADVIVAKGGNDRINGRGGKDVICAGDGDDVVMGGGGADRLDGGPGSDVLSGGPGNDFIGGGTGLADSVDYLTNATGSVEVNLPAGIGGEEGTRSMVLRTSPERLSTMPSTATSSPTSWSEVMATTLSLGIAGPTS